MIKHIPLTCVALLLAISLYATTDKYRLTLRDDPATSIVIGWNQIDGTGVTVYYGTTDQGTDYASYSHSTGATRSVGFAGMDNHFARLSGLQPNTIYYFVIKDSNSTSPRFWFKTAPNVPTERLAFIAGGDSRNNRTPRQNGNRLVSKLKPHAVLFGGDMTNACTNTEWKQWFDDWQFTISDDGRMYPIVAARGNHETNDDYIYHLFDTPRNNNSVYYALTFGGSLIRAYTLNTEIPVGGDQESWLHTDLLAHDHIIWKAAQYHKPIRPHVGGKPEKNDQYDAWARKFYDYNVKLVVECDAHTVKTTWPIIPSTNSGNDEGFIRDDANGTVYVGEGCWGAPNRPNDDNKSWTRNSGDFNQFKWIFVDQSKIEVRTIKLDNVTSVGENPNNNPFAIPANLDTWKPSNGEVVTILNNNVTLPTVAITAPGDGAYYQDLQTITVSADASDADGSVSSVAFYSNGELIATDNAAPYAVSFTIPGDGSFQLTAVATDNDGNTKTSDMVNITAGDYNFLDDAESLSGWQSSGSIALSPVSRQGANSIEFVGQATDEFRKAFTTAYNSGADPTHARLEFWYYVSDVSKLVGSNQVELGSGGAADVNEYNWKLNNLNNGWNFISLKTNEPRGVIGNPDLNAINWFRLYNTNKSGSVTTRIDGLKIVDPSVNYSVRNIEDLDNGSLFHFSVMSDNKGESPLQASNSQSLTSMQRLDAWIQSSEFVIGLGDHLVSKNEDDPFLSFIQNDPYWKTNFYPNIADGENQAFGKNQGAWGTGWELFNYVDNFFGRSNVDMQPNKVDYYAHFSHSGFKIHLIQLHFPDEPKNSTPFREESRAYMQQKLDSLAPIKTNKDIIIVAVHSYDGDFVRDGNLNAYRKNLLLSTADICLSATIHTFERYPQYNVDYPNGAVHYNTGAACHTGSTHGYMEFHVLDNPPRVVIQYINTEDNATRQLQTGYIDGIGDPTLAIVKEINGPAYEVDWATLPLSTDDCPNDPDKSAPGDCGCGIPEGTCTPHTLVVNNGTGDGSYAHDATVSITADTPPASQVFDRWVVNSGVPNIADATASSTTLVMGTEDASVTATYKASNLTNGAEFVSRTVPNEVIAGDTVSVTVVMKNTGLTTWTNAEGYKLGSQNQQDNTDWGFNRVQLETNDEIAPGQNKAFTFEIYVPETPGTYNFQWKMVQENVEWFGDPSLNLEVQVAAAPGDNQLTSKLMMGYQGWFLAKPDNSVPNEWRHWFTNGAGNDTPDAAYYGADMWPDMSEYSMAYNTNMTYADGSNAQLFSSYDSSTTNKHFEWMRDYNIHGVYLQRFIAEAQDSRFFDTRNQVLSNVINAAAMYDRKFALMYDLSDWPTTADLSDQIKADWEYLELNYNVPNNPGYARQEGKPVIAIWGIGFQDRGLALSEIQDIITYFKNRNGGMYLVGGVPSQWATLTGDSESGSEWRDVYRSLDMLSPWTVGRYATDPNNNWQTEVDNWLNTKIKPDLDTCLAQGMDYMPVIWPGFSSHNIYNNKPLNEVPRRGGDFYWRQAYNVINEGIDFVYVAMFDEVDEGTAMFKTAETKADVPVQLQNTLITMDEDGEALPSDWYLQLAGQTQDMLDGTIPISSTIPISPSVNGNGAVFISQDVPPTLATGASFTATVTMKNTGTTTFTPGGLYKLGSQNTQDNVNWGTNRIELGTGMSVAPNEQVTFTLSGTAPANPGVYNFQWRMVQDQVEWFGASSENFLITVGNVSNFLDDCDATTGWGSSQTLSLNTTTHQQGSGSLSFTGSTEMEFQKVFSPAHNGSLDENTAVLRFWYYISDASQMTGVNQVELGSGGTADSMEYNWSLPALQNGWNLINLQLSEASKIGTPDINAINWFRLYNFKSTSITTGLDAIQLIDPQGGVNYEVVVNSGSGDGTYADSTAVSISADAPPSGKEFDAWVITEGTATIADINAANTTLTINGSSVIVGATYKDVDYDLVVTSGTGDGAYTSGTDVTIVADPAPEGQEFDAWVIVSGSPAILDANAISTNLVMGAQNAEVQATYRNINYTLTVGSGTGDGSYTFNENATITADAAPSGQEFDRWVIASGSATLADELASSTTLTMGANDVTVNATYVTTTYALVVNSGNGSGSYAPGAQVNISAYAAPAGQVFAGWVIDAGTPTIADASAASTTLTMSTGTATISATYQAISNGATYVSQSGVPSTLNVGQTATVSVTMQNSGTSTWTRDALYKLGSQNNQDNTDWGFNRVWLDVSDQIAPNQNKVFTFDITAPATAGQYNFQWKMVQDHVEWFGGQSANVSITVVDPNQFLDDCDALTGWSTSSSNNLILSGTVQQGTNSVKIVGSGTDEFKKVFSPAYNSGLTATNARLEFWYYVSSPGLMSTSSNQVELGSGGGPDVNEYNWTISSFSSGWNFISLDISNAGITGGTPNLNAINWFRIYNSKSGSVTNRIDAIKLVNNGSSRTAEIDVDQSVDISIYPVPATDFVTVDAGSLVAEKVTAKVYNLAGIEVSSMQLEKASGNTWSIPVSGLESGLYVLHLSLDEHRIAKRIIIR
ncbi:InlB B-repeat-containing protein [Marinoscillum furvescens]|uniref:Putative secreted protein (Por secretion system target) n=1 Tax=Marinoscillum furvescens DSM 4134 TaxID=1122208 RepID=A0A3D9KZW2_MARFU|nr:NBR1-Ig-like domain-containing protein [Marinoscillum furvescens]RED94952.1 putative secreted protein (Por secretion system target) [Marinoscillum furvescens DSM 4134]